MCRACGAPGGDAEQHAGRNGERPETESYPASTYAVTFESDDIGEYEQQQGGRYRQKDDNDDAQCEIVQRMNRLRSSSSASLPRLAST